MDDFKKDFSTPTLIKASLPNRSPQPDLKQRSCLSKEHNENEPSPHHNQVSSKKSISKHFMSPTISAKAKKRIMGEKWEPGSEQDLGILRYPLSPLNPRPEFRAYNPNKRDEILIRHEQRGRLGMVEKSRQEQVPRNDLEEDEEFEEDEELEEEKDGVLLKVLKFLLVLSALFLSTLHISSMSSTVTPGSSLQARRDLKIQDQCSLVSYKDIVWGRTPSHLTTENGNLLKGATETVASEGGVKDGMLEQELKRPRVGSEGDGAIESLDDMLEQELKRPSVVSEGDNAIESLDLLQVFEIHYDKPMMSWGSSQLLAENVSITENTGKDEGVKIEVANVKPLMALGLYQFSAESFATGVAIGEDDVVKHEVEKIVNNLDEVVEHEVESVVNILDEFHAEHEVGTAFNKLDDMVVEHEVENAVNKLDNVVVEHEVDDVVYNLDEVVSENEVRNVNQLSAEGVITGEAIGEDEEKLVNDLDEVSDEHKVECVVKNIGEVVVEHDVENIVNDLDEVAAEHEVENVISTMNDMGKVLTLQWRDIEDDTEALGIPGKSDSFSCKIHEKKIILEEILGTCEIDVDSSKQFSDQAENVESTLAEDVAAIGIIMLLAGIVGSLYGKFKRHLKRDTSPLIQPNVESFALEEDNRGFSFPPIQPDVEPIALEEDNGGFSFAMKNEYTEKKERFTKAEYDIHPPASVDFKEQQVTELNERRVPTVQLLTEYEVSARFNRSSVNISSCERVLVDTPQRKQGISPSRQSVSQFCSPSRRSIALDKDNERLSFAEEKEQFAKAEYHINSPVFVQFEEHKFTELNKSRVPAVQLLAEYEDATWSSRNSVNISSCESIPVDTPQRKQGMSSRSQSLSQFYSTTEITSNGKHTPQGKMPRRKVGSDKSRVTTTVLRRSERIRNKTISSPQMA